MPDMEARTAVVADDNLMFTTMVEPQLRRLGYLPRTMGGGEGLAARIADARPELVLVNMTADRFDAALLIRELRAHSGAARTRIIGYAGHVERERFAAGLEAGADLVVPNSAVRASLAEVLARLDGGSGRRAAETESPREE